MDLRTFFGDWTVNQTILVKQGDKSYLASLKKFTADEVLIKTSSERTLDSFSFGIISQSHGTESDTYDATLQTGIGIIPSTYAGGDLKGVVLLHSPKPSSLVVSGEYILSSNTISFRVSGNMAMTRKYGSEEKSTLLVNINEPSSDVQVYEFIGER
ncbi:MAG: hypothetical protein AB8B56_11530 [Crocinitomicaceae bacterium]